MRSHYRTLLTAAAFAGLLISSAVRAADGPTPPGDPQKWPGTGPAWDGEHFQNRRALFWSERQKDQGAVVWFGDSITEGWRTLAQDFPQLKTANRGISGDCSRGLLFRLKEDVLDLNPAGVIITIGINDLASGAQPTDVAHNIRRIVDGIRAARPGIPIIICHIMPWKSEPGEHTVRIKQTNALIDALMMGRPKVKVCDTFGAFALPDGTAPRELFPDLLHPNDAGRAVWKKTLVPVMQSVGMLTGQTVSS